MSTIQNQIESNPILEEPVRKKSQTGINRSVTQIVDTIKFEINKNLKKTLNMIFFFTIIAMLNILTTELSYSGGVSLPTDPIDYINGYLIFFSMLMIVAAATYGGSIIAEDFQERTANLLFPKITKGKLLTGRIIAMYTLNALVLAIYYCEIALMTFYKYSEVPIILWSSLAWALLYGFAILSFAIFFSSVMKTTSAAVISTILILLMVFRMIESILVFTGVTWEPFFSLTYYSNIIRAIFDMPVDSARYTLANMGPGGGDLDFYSWSTPNITGAFWGLLIYSIICLALAWFFFRKRQVKN